MTVQVSERLLYNIHKLSKFDLFSIRFVELDRQLVERDRQVTETTSV